MSDSWHVVVEGDGANLFKVWNDDGTYKVYHEHFRYIGANDEEYIGEADSLKEACIIIMNASGKEIDNIEEIE